jgi:adenylate cyclase
MSTETTSTKTFTDEAGRKVFEGRLHSTAQVQDVWDVMADTQRLNEVVFKLAPTELVEKGADLARMRTKIGPVTVEFDELAWTFDAPHRYRSVRLFHSGPLKKLEVECEITPDNGGSAVLYRVLATTGGIVSFAADAWIMNQVQTGFSQLGPMLDRLSASDPDLWSAPPTDAAQIAARARPLAAATEQLDPGAGGRIAALVDVIARSSDSDVIRLRPYEFARRRHDDRDATLATFLRATRAGLLTMRWDVMCPSCALPVAQVADLQAKHQTMECKGCRVTFETRPNSNVEAAFSPPSSVRDAHAVMFCLGSPRRTSHWISQFTLAPKETRILRPRLSAGRYRMQATGINQQTLIDIGATGESKGKVIIEHLAGRGAVMPDSTVPLRAGDLEIECRNEDSVVHVLQLVHDAFADDAATATHVIQTPVWRELFGS